MVAIVKMDSSGSGKNSAEMTFLRNALGDLSRSTGKEIEDRKAERDRLERENATKRERLKELESKIIAASLGQPIKKIMNLFDRGGNEERDVIERGGSCPQLGPSAPVSIPSAPQHPLTVVPTVATIRHSTRRFGLEKMKMGPKLKFSGAVDQEKEAELDEVITRIDHERKAKVDEIVMKISKTNSAIKDLELEAQGQSQAISCIMEEIEKMERTLDTETADDEATAVLTRSSSIVSMKSTAHAATSGNTSVRSDSSQNDMNGSSGNTAESRIEKHESWIRYLQSMINKHRKMEANLKIKLRESKSREKRIMPKEAQSYELESKVAAAKQMLLKAQGASLYLNDGKRAWTCFDNVEQILQGVHCNPSAQACATLIEEMRRFDECYFDVLAAASDNSNTSSSSLCRDSKDIVNISSSFLTSLKTLTEFIDSLLTCATHSRNDIPPADTFGTVKEMLNVVNAVRERLDVALLYLQVSLLQNLEQIVMQNATSIKSIEDSWQAIIYSLLTKG